MIRRAGLTVGLGQLALLVACGGSPSRPAAKSTDGPAEKLPDAPAAPCMEVPIVNTDVSFDEVAPGETVAFDGVPRTGPKTCRSTGCKGECCSACKGGYVIMVRGPESRATAIELGGLAGCTGTDCGVDCDPFGRTPTREYRFVGELTETRSTTAARYRLDVVAYCLLPEEGAGDGAEDAQDTL